MALLSSSENFYSSRIKSDRPIKASNTRSIVAQPCTHSTLIRRPITPRPRLIHVRHGFYILPTTTIWIHRPLPTGIRLFQRTRLRQRRVRCFRHAGHGGGQAAAGHPARRIAACPRVYETEVFACGFARGGGKGERDGVARTGILDGADESRAIADVRRCACGVV